MLKFVTKMFRKKPEPQVSEPVYELPSDNPELNPVLVQEAGDSVQMQDVASLNSQLLATIPTSDSAGMSVRTRAVFDMKTGIQDLSDHVRSLGQRLHAQSMGQAKLVEVLTGLPAILKDALPDKHEQNNVLGALKLAMDEQNDSNKAFVDALKPLPKFVEAAANLPETARKQMWAMNELTKQLEDSNDEAREQSSHVKMMVETLVEQNGEKSEEVKRVVDDLTKYQKAQLKQAALTLKSNEAARKAAHKHQGQVQRDQQNRMSVMQRDQSRHFNRIEDHFKRSSRRQLWATGVAVCLAVVATAFAALIATGVLDFGMDSKAPVATDAQERPATDGAVVEK
ncbi:hypothetical protein OAU50_05625 [Planctomycetota bacterium]|nr:hypothetical protein [Planctomycetota bacterium]